MHTIQREILDLINMGILQQNINKSIFACHGNAHACGWWKNLNRDKILNDERYIRIRSVLEKEGFVDDLDTLLLLEEDLTTETRGIGNIFMLWITEIAEGYEGYRKNMLDDHLPAYEMKDVEAGDLYIRLCDYMGQRERETNGKVNFGKIISDKLVYNMTRPDHKLEKRLEDDGKKL